MGTTAQALRALEGVCPTAARSADGPVGLEVDCRYLAWVLAPDNSACSCSSLVRRVPIVRCTAGG